MDRPPDPGPSPISAVEPAGSPASEQVEAMVAAWKRGERPPAERFLEGRQGFDDEAAVRLIFEECCLRQEAGMAVDPLEFARRFPRLWPDLELLLDCQQLMEPPGAPAELPEVGEELAGFRLLAELGRGAAGKVFLASQSALADRPVVIKVAPPGREEHLSLARLQHMNIVPLYSAQVLPDLRLQVLCMPFLGGSTLAEVLDLLKDHDPAGRTGNQIIDALDQIQARLPVSLPPARGPFRRHIARSPYVEAICWVGIGLADGLQYAHDRNFVHMDIKPSNVLLSGDAQPMLLDFHLAREPLGPGDPAPAHLGGTPGYMAPEQAEAMDAVGDGRAIRKALDGRADVYSLGLLLHEALGGLGPGKGPRRPLARCNPSVPWGLSDIIDRCLRPDPDDRYPDAASLAADLRRFQDGRALRGVPNRSLVERWRNWRRRSPHALIRVAILLASALTASASIALLGAVYIQRVHEVEAALDDGRSSLDRHEYAEATKALTHGLALARHLPSAGGYRDALAESLARARREAKADDLHQLAELVRFRYGIDPPPSEEAEALIRKVRALWRDREFLVKPIAGRKDPEFEARIRADLLEVAFAWATLLDRSSAPGVADGSTGEVARVLDEAKALLGPNAAIDRDRRAHAAHPGTVDPPPNPGPGAGSASGHFELGKSYLRAGETSPAAEQFRLGLALRPQDFWLNFYEGICAYRLGRFEDAVNAFRVCIALSPRSAECHFNRALALGALGRSDESIADYTRALQLNPMLTPAAINRGMLYYQLSRLDDAVADLDAALATTSARGDRGIIRYNLALVALARGDRPAALSNLEIAEDNGHEAARALRDRLRK